MKKILAALLLMALMIGPCALADGDLPESLAYRSENGTLTIELAANSTTGYEWSYTLKKPGALTETEVSYIEDENPGDLAGVGGTYVLKLAAGSFSGKTELTLTYAQPWDTAGKAYVIEMDLRIQDGMIFVQSVDAED